MSAPKQPGFDPYGEHYREAVQDSISFSGVDHEVFSRAKAKRLLRLAARDIGDPHGLSFLDLGCGPGETDAWFEGRVGELTGVDVSSEMVRIAGERNPWATFQQADAGKPLPFSDDSFDLSFAICVLHHVDLAARGALVAEMARVTRRGGTIAIIEHNPWNPLTRKAVAGCEFDRDAVLLTRRESERLLHGAGAESVEGSYITFFTRESPRLERIEALLRGFPLGAQHLVSGRRR